MKRVTAIAICLGACAGFVVQAKGQEWTRFRGPNGTGVAKGGDSIPVKWSESDYNWRVRLPGIGHSQPVLWGERIFLTSATRDGGERMVLCIAAGDGKVLWQRSYPSTTHRKHQYNSFASPTPAVTAERVYVVFSTPEAYTVMALDHAGNEVWHKDLGPYYSRHSCGASPVVFEGLVVLANDQGEDPEETGRAPVVDDGKSSLVALDARTGSIRWQTRRKSREVAYSTPCVYQPENGPAQLLFNSGAHGISAVEAHTGKTIWEAPVFSMRTCSSPVVAGGLVIGTCGSGGGGNYLVAVKPGGSGDVSNTHVAYKLTKVMPYVPTPITHGDLLFLWGDKGVVTCVNAPTGETVWTERVGGNYFGSPIRVQDRLYCLGVDGDCVVLAANGQFKVLARNPVGEGSHSTPTVAGGRLYLRTFSHLISLGGKTGSGSSARR